MVLIAAASCGAAATNLRSMGRRAGARRNIAGYTKISHGYIAECGATVRDGRLITVTLDAAT